MNALYVLIIAGLLGLAAIIGSSIENEGQESSNYTIICLGQQEHWSFSSAKRLALSTRLDSNGIPIRCKVDRSIYPIPYNGQ